MRKKMHIEQFISGGCYSYILSSEGEAFIIDPHVSLEASYEKYLKSHNLKLSFIIDTHTHADHFSLAAILKEKYRIPVFMHEKAISSVADKRLADGNKISLNEIVFDVLYAPGHTDDTINIYGEGMVFTADVLLIGSVGRTDFQNGSPESMFDTLQKLKNLPDETLLFPAHDYNGKKKSTIFAEKENNPFMKENDKERFIQNAKVKKLPKPFNIDNIIRVNQNGQARGLRVISAKDAFSKIKTSPEARLLDVRTPAEFSQAHIDGSLHIPVDTLAARITELEKQNREYIVFCRTGNRSFMAADILIQHGIGVVLVMDGGMVGWQRQKLPFIKGEGRMSLERQIRVIAGSLVFLGILLSRALNPHFIWVSVFVSCGLIYAGLTDNCFMGMLLMKLSYNRKTYKAAAGGGTCSISQ